MDFEARSIEARGNMSTNRRLTFEHGLPRENQNRVIAPVGDNLFDILSSSREIGPFGISAQQLLSLRRGIELPSRTTHKRKCDDE